MSFRLFIYYSAFAGAGSALAGWALGQLLVKGEGLVARWGRKVLEIRPPLEADKGRAVEALLARSGASRALYAGDDTTDLDGFAGLDAAELEAAVRVAVASSEGPEELRAAADLVVDGPAEFLAVLRRL